MENKIYFDKHFEYDIAFHCNMTCYACSHVAPYFEKAFVSLEQYERDITILSKYIQIRELRLLGGEPLLHKEVPKFIEIAKGTGLARKVGVTTNGTLLLRQPVDFWDRVDNIHLSLYQAVADSMDMAGIRRMADEHNVNLNIDDRPQFTERVIDFPIKDEQLVRDIFTACPMSNFCHTIRDGRIFRCAVSAFIDKYLGKLGYETNFFEEDGLLIEDREGMGERLKAYFGSDTHLKACTFCLGVAGKKVVHRIMKQSEIRGLKPTKTVEEYLDTRRLKWHLGKARVDRAIASLPVAKKMMDVVYRVIKRVMFR